MKSTGITRKVDILGRIVLPKELRNLYKIDNGDSLEIFVDGNKMVLQKYEPCCIFCGEASDVWNFKSKNICGKCSNEFINEYSRNHSDEPNNQDDVNLEDDVNL